MTENNIRTRLEEVDFFRAFIVVTLIFMHACVYNAGSATWPLPEGIQMVPTWLWLWKITFSCLLESFTFISGYVYGYSILKNKNLGKFQDLIRKKTRRLIIPSLVFGAIYSLFFYNRSFSITRYCYDLLCGIGHMWYLPMLFGCFVIAFFLLRYDVNPKLVLSVSLLLSIISPLIPNYFQISRVLYFFFFFYLGVFIITKRDYLKEKAIKYGYCAILLFLVLLLPLLELKEIIVERGLNVIIPTVVQIIYSTLGVFCCYLFFFKCSYNSVPRNSRFVRVVLYISSISMGIYIIHQFVLKAIYYCTPVPRWCGSYLLPWLGFAIALSLSIIIAMLLRKTKVGSFLLG